MSLAVAGFQAPANAQNAQADVIRVLQSQGFDITLQKRTLLGRVKIKATNGKFVREVIILPATGEVLRDILQYASGSKRGQNAWSEFLNPRENPPDHSAAGGEGKRAGGISAKPEDPGRSNIPDHANGRPQSSDNDKTDQTSGQSSNTRSNANPAPKEKNNRADKVKQAPQDNSSDTQYNDGGSGNSAKKDAAKSSSEAKGDKNKQTNAPPDKANSNAGGGRNKTNSGTDTKADKQDNSDKKSSNGKSVGKDDNGDPKGNSGNNKNKGDKENRPANGKSEGAGSSGKDKGASKKD